jgi:hypothetical protein
LLLLLLQCQQPLSQLLLMLSQHQLHRCCGCLLHLSSKHTRLLGHVRLQVVQVMLLSGREPRSGCAKE